MQSDSQKPEPRAFETYHQENIPFVQSVRTNETSRYNHIKTEIQVLINFHKKLLFFGVNMCKDDTLCMLQLSEQIEFYIRVI